MNAAASRILAVDAARGLALAGMLLVNLGVFSRAANLPFSRLGAVDRAAAFLTLLLAEGKFYPIFALLFGWGLARQLRLGAPQENQGRPVRTGPVRTGRIRMRRMLLLCVVGLLHGLLLWPGDILFVYGCLGLLLVSFCQIPRPHPVSPAKTPALWKWSIVLVLLLTPALLALDGPGKLLSQQYNLWLYANLPPPASPAHLPWPTFLWKLALFHTWGTPFAALILAGFWTDPLRLPERIISPPWWVLPVGLALNLFVAITAFLPTITASSPLPADSLSALRIAALNLGGPLLAWAYAAGLLRLAPPRILAWLANVGRLPLTTYLCQSLIAALIFHFVPFRPGPALLWPLTALIFTAQLLAARLWLAHFSHGPFEWAWRRLSA